MSSNQCRVEFESWVTAIPSYGSFRIIKRDGGDYDSSHTQLMWLSWKEAWKQSSQYPVVSDEKEFLHED